MAVINPEVIRHYVSAIRNEEHHRYASWDQCFEAFSREIPDEYSALNLGFYLASWGMYRGSGGLLQKNHLVHKGVVEIIFQNKYRKIKCREGLEVDRGDLEVILDLKEKLSRHYKMIEFKRGNNPPKSISPTNTLISKIMLGTLGCVPAYDRFFIRGLKQVGMRYKSFSKQSLLELFDLISNEKMEIKNIQNFVMEQLGHHYPAMKIVDMFFWQVGFNSSNKGEQLKY